MKTFHEFVHEIRIRQEIGLREFCRAIELDPSNWSKVERGIADPPKSKALLERIIKLLKLNEDDNNTLIVLAMVEAIPADLRPTENVIDKLPLLIDIGKKCSKEYLEKILDKLSKS